MFNSSKPVNKHYQHSYTDGNTDIDCTIGIVDNVNYCKKIIGKKALVRAAVDKIYWAEVADFSIRDFLNDVYCDVGVEPWSIRGDRNIQQYGDMFLYTRTFFARSVTFFIRPSNVAPSREELHCKIMYDSDIYFDIEGTKNG